MCQLMLIYDQNLHIQVINNLCQDKQPPHNDHAEQFTKFKIMRHETMSMQ